MLPELRVLIERAAARRLTLDGLLDALPAGYWERVAPGESWSIRAQAGHLWGADDTMSGLLDDILGGAEEAWLAGTDDAAALQALRFVAVEASGGFQPEELRLRITDARAGVVVRIRELSLPQLEAGIRIAGVTDRWGAPRRWTLREYLEAWTRHDPEHEESIRRAISTPPDLSTVVLTQRRRG